MMTSTSGEINPITGSQCSKPIPGNISKKENRKIEIFWEWEYDVNIEKDLIDTNDAKNIEKYNFEIYIITQ